MNEITGRPIDYVLISTPGGERWIEYGQQVELADVPALMEKWRVEWKAIKNSARLNFGGNTAAEINVRFKLFSKKDVLSFCAGRIILTVPWDQ